MFACIDCGTTTTRIYIIREDGMLAAQGRTKAGVRDTSITGSRDKLRNAVTDLFYQVIRENGINDQEVRFAIASGMITSEIGLLEVPHITAPAGIKELTAGICIMEDPAVLPIGRPVCFIPGVRNHYSENVNAWDLRSVDFMRGEEVQVIGILASRDIPLPANIVCLSSHTKIIHVNQAGQIEASCTTISGQLYEALVSATSIGKSIVPMEGEEPGGYGYEELINIARDCVEHGGLGRTMLMPRFLQVLMQTDSRERITFTDAAIAADDLHAFREMEEQGYGSDHYLIFGQESRCRMYQYMLQGELKKGTKIEIIYDTEEIDMFTVRGMTAVAKGIPQLRT